MVTPVMEASVRIREFIDKLASNPSSAATEAFETLLADGRLRSWHSLLVDAIFRQSAVRREAEFRYRDVERVIQVLDNHKPANAADLAALTSDLLAVISGNIRDGSTSDWRQYWNVDDTIVLKIRNRKTRAAMPFCPISSSKWIRWALICNPRVITPMTSDRTFVSPAAASTFRWRSREAVISIFGARSKRS